jgi:PilZ domain
VQPEKRRTPRYVFFASAELFDERSEVRIASRVSELGLNGCYLDMMNPFNVDTIVLLKIFAGDAAFKTRAKVVYSQPNIGAGVAFIDVEPESLAILQHWIEELAKEASA